MGGVTSPLGLGQDRVIGDRVDADHEPIGGRVEDAELFLYPGDQHYFADSSLPSYDRDATALVTRRVLEFLDRL